MGRHPAELNELKTSERWAIDMGLIVLNFSGWENYKFKNSWEKEPMNLEEFKTLLLHSVKKEETTSVRNNFLKARMPYDKKGDGRRRKKRIYGKK